MKSKLGKLFFPYDDRPDHFKGLDGLRGIAVLLVLLSHSSNVKIMFHEALNFQRMGKIGVYLFFVLSAYLLDRQIALAYMTHKSSIRYWLNYFLRRFLRIYPLFFIALLIHGYLTSIGFITVINEKWDIPLHMIFSKGEGIFWSIAVEFKYYFMSPLIMWLCHRYLKWNLMSVLLFIVLLTTVSIFIEYAYELPVISTVRYLPIFLTGTFLSIFELLKRDSFADKKKSSLFGIAGLVALILILISIPTYFEMIFGYRVNIHRADFYLPYAILWALVLLAAKYGNGLIKAVFSFKPLRYIGVISFSMYLFHLPILKFTRIYIDAPNNIKIYIFLLLSILFSTVTFLLIERPLSKIKIFHGKLTEKEIENKKVNKPA